MKRRLFATLAAAFLGMAGVAVAVNRFSVTPGEFDPARTFLVQAEWSTGIGCPTNARISTDGTTTSTYTDTACPTGDGSDKKNEGLLLAKTGPTGNFAAAVAEIKGVRGKTLSELGWDIRKPRSVSDPSGSHCGGGAPRWNIETTDGGFYFLGCNSVPPATTTPGAGFLRMRWGGSAPLVLPDVSTGTPADVRGKRIESLTIVFDEGYDTGPDNFGLAVLDNIDINGTLVGKGGKNDHDHGDDHDDHDRDHGHRYGKDRDDD